MSIKGFMRHLFGSGMEEEALVGHTELPTVSVKGRQYYFDEKLMELREVVNPHNKLKLYHATNFFDSDRNMYNYEVAEMWVNNALDYTQRGNLDGEQETECLKTYLAVIKTLLQDPTKINNEHRWADFQ